MKLFEMEGFLRGKCIPRDLKVNETNAEYLVRKFAEADAKCAALAAENAALKAAFDKPQAYLSWHAIPPTWEDPLPCGEYLDVHDEGGHKNSDGTDCWPVFAKPEIETPGTDTFLAEVRAQGLNAFIQHHSAELDAHIKNGGEQFDEKSVRIRDIIVSARLFREQIRKEAAQ
ncbi:hNH endonuclease [Enterobacter kobei]